MVPQLLNLVIIAVIAGGALYLFQLLLGDATIKRIATVLILIVAVVWAIRWLMQFAH